MHNACFVAAARTGQCCRALAQQKDRVACMERGWGTLRALNQAQNEVLTPVPPPRSTQTMLVRPSRRAAQAASMGLRPHRKLALKLSSAQGCKCLIPG